MNLRVFTPEKKDTEGNVVQEETSRVLFGITDFHMELTRNTFRAVHRTPNGALVTEEGELHRLFPKGEVAGYVFGLPGDLKAESAVGTLIDPTTRSTAAITSPVGGTVRQAEVTRVEPTGNQGDLQPGAPRAVEVPGSTGRTASVADLAERLKQMKNNPSVEREMQLELIPTDEASKQIKSEQPKAPEGGGSESTNVQTESAVGHLTDPTTTPTDKITGGAQNDMLAVNNPQENRQGPTNPPEVKP